MDAYNVTLIVYLIAVLAGWGGVLCVAYLAWLKRSLLQAALAVLAAALGVVASYQGLMMLASAAP